MRKHMMKGKTQEEEERKSEKKPITDKSLRPEGRDL